jgi:UDP-glucose 4-epimerase
MAACLVTGGAGFIGAHLVEALVARGHRVRVLDNFSTGKLENLANVRGEIELLLGDLTNFSDVCEALRGIEVVFHQAGPAASSQAERDPLATRVGSATGTLHLLIAARDARVRRFVYASSSSVYGHGREMPLLESDILQPLTPSAAAALAGEQDCVVFTYTYGLETVRLRYFNVFGPRQLDSPHDLEITALIRAMVAGRPPVIHGNGEEPQDLVYVDDVVYANLLALEAPRVSGKVYNIGRGRSTTALEVVDLVNSLLGTRLLPTFEAPRQRHASSRIADSSSAEVDLGFCCSTDLEDGVRRCIEYYAARPGLTLACADRDIA